jgi:hypothetical protein
MFLDLARVVNFDYKSGNTICGLSTSLAVSPKVFSRQGLVMSDPIQPTISQLQ